MKSFEEMVNESYESFENDSKGSLVVLPKLDIDIITTRLHWKNVCEYLTIINRDPDHFLKYLKNQLPGKNINWYSAMKEEGLLFHGKFQKQNYVYDLAKKYVAEYVICPSCSKSESTLTKDSKINRYNFECTECKFTSMKV
jgi:translation initiation factor 2 beta subunit (eIF-2beta)/eIF-5